MLANKLLMIHNDSEQGILTIKLQYPFNLLSKEQQSEFKKFLNAHLNAVKAFKKEMDISANCVKIDRDDAGNIVSLRITMPTPALYDVYIKNLASKFLLPIQVIEQVEKPVYERGVNHFIPTAPSTKLTPAAPKCVAVDEIDKAAAISQEEQPRLFNPQPQLVPRPWGWKE